MSKFSPHAKHAILRATSSEHQPNEERRKMLFEQEISVSFLEKLKSRLLDTEKTECQYITQETLDICIYNAALDLVYMYPETDTSSYIETIAPTAIEQALEHFNLQILPHEKELCKDAHEATVHTPHNLQDLQEPLLPGNYLPEAHEEWPCIELCCNGICDFANSLFNTIFSSR
jgi:hypothetical protein